jgi:hypothetical protein
MNLPRTCDCLAVVGSCVVKLAVVCQLQVGIKHVELRGAVQSMYALLLPCGVSQLWWFVVTVVAL